MRSYCEIINELNNKAQNDDSIIDIDRKDVNNLMNQLINILVVYDI